ncbi:DUF805 domain-containing protein [Promicromonospora kroppenstedtii]|uniref:DUF805 domain-containing protein n=1 Tax=Promicromonospora kroppenstedtii TaxID=440482 RepID=UPI0004B53388|nr:DUF805 domain-containing protein [Promicromonospora kroppenstedtii]
MTLVEAVRTCLRKYGVFTGRARAAEYWLFYLGLAIVNAVIFVALLLPALITMDPVTQEPGVLGSIGSSLVGVVALAAFVPLLAAGVRRLHDTGKSGWFYLLCLVPFVGGIVIIVLLALPGESGPNRFGPDPRAVRQPVTV